MNWTSKLSWMNLDHIRPYVFVRDANKVAYPGRLHWVDWFPQDPLVFDALSLKNSAFGKRISWIEAQAFKDSDMVMPGWVFYDCAVMPGVVMGFAQKTSTLTGQVKKVFEGAPECDWTPLSLFIPIPTLSQNEWVAHNLTSINALLPKEEKFYGLGFLSKAFGLWYANIPVLCGMTQWGSPSIPLHSHYGVFEILTAYTPIHSFAQTLTYRCTIKASLWEQFFTKSKEAPFFADQFEPASFEVDPKSEESLKGFQSKIEDKQGPYYFSPTDLRTQNLKDPIKVFKRKPTGRGF